MRKNVKYLYNIDNVLNFTKIYFLKPLWPLHPYTANTYSSPHSQLSLSSTKKGGRYEGFFGGSDREVPFKRRKCPNGWNHKAQQEMQRCGVPCLLHCLLGGNDCQFQLRIQQRKPTEVTSIGTHIICL